MKLLTKPNEREKEFKRLMGSYSEYYWASAWASVDFDCFEDLKKSREKIRKIIVGISFDHTHPKFIETFIKNKNVKFFDQPTELFHPKIYLFKKEDDWEILIGSMNFSSAGLSRNVETLVLINNKEIGAGDIYDSTIELINQNWKKACYFTEEKLQRYKEAFRNQQKRSGEYVIKRPGKPPNRTKFMNLSWNEFVRKVKEEGKGKIKKRIKLLKTAHSFFLKRLHFNDMSLDERNIIAGTRQVQNEMECDWFGYMYNFVFMKKINDNDINISKALDQIPIEGQVTKKDYSNFIRFFEKAFLRDKRKGKVTGFRLLAMKRPDIFICLTSKNKKKLEKDFGIKGEINFERYWDDIIERIFDSEWYKSSAPKDKEELEIWKGRSAFLDSLYYK